MSDKNEKYDHLVRSDFEQLLTQIKDLVRATVIDKTADINHQCDLLKMGVDSISMMKISGVLRKAGCSVSFVELIASPTLSSWKALIHNSHRASVASKSDAVTRSGIVDISRDMAHHQVDPFAPFDLALIHHDISDMRFLRCEEEQSFGITAGVGHLIAPFWEETCLGVFSLHNVPGNHFSVIEPPHVEVVADYLAMPLRSL